MTAERIAEVIIRILENRYQVEIEYTLSDKKKNLLIKPILKLDKFKNDDLLSLGFPYKLGKKRCGQ
jgi:hypothetical protein